jgi:aminoglycoside phosphotransferase (APT) family kinase protein
MGRAYARLAELRTVTGALPALDHATCGAQHARRVMKLGERLAPLADSTTDWTDLTTNRVPGAPPLVITHGDPGPGNFLDDGQRGSIIDWEEAQIAPRGLDLARLMLIARLGAGPHGYAAQDHEQRAHAAVHGYLDALSDQWLPSQEEARWWTAVAGVQFIHSRWRRAGQPAPWQDAAHVLRDALTQASPWTPT